MAGKYSQNKFVQGIHGSASEATLITSMPMKEIDLYERDLKVYIE